MDPMINRIARYVSAHAMFPRGGAVLVGVSGGADSVALLRVLALLRERLGISLQAAHFHHGIRAASDGEERFVTELCAELGLQLHTGRADVPARARQRGVSTEVAARDARHAFFRQAMHERGIGILALAHHRGDQAETVLLRLVRGSGAAGLAAMAPVEENGIVRPLLCVGRREILGWCGRNGFAWMEDASNADLAIPRNWVRHELLPRIAEHLNPSAEDALCRAAELLREDERFLTGLAEAALGSTRTLADGGVTTPAADLAALPAAVRGRALRLLMRRAGMAQDAEQAHVDAVDALLAPGRSGRRADLGFGAVAYREADMLVLSRALPSHAACGPVPLAVPGATQACGGVFTAELLDKIPPDVTTHSKDFEYFDFVAFPKGAEARSRLPGDRFRPLGAPGERKLKQVLIDRKAGRWGRDAIPLVALGTDVLWIVGHGISDSVKITEKTERVIKITYTKRSSE